RTVSLGQWQAVGLNFWHRNFISLVNNQQGYDSSTDIHGGCRRIVTNRQKMDCDHPGAKL
ncbi:hypothetical protein AB1Y32_15610, partial [Escherichia coli]